MRILLTAATALTLALAAGCSGKSDGGAAASGAATAADFNGDWTVVGHIVAPWVTGPEFLPEPDADILAKTLTISATSLAGPAALACDAATFETKTLPRAGLFEGNVPDPYIQASALGVEQEDTPTLVAACTSGGADREFNFHRIGKDKLLLGLDNIIYQFGRPAPAAEPAAPPADAPKPQ